MRGENKRFGETIYYMNGRAPGFASFILYLPQAQMTVVLLSNIYSSATTMIGYDVAALSMGLPYEPLHFRDPAPSSAELKTCEGKFRFGADFYQPNAVTTLLAKRSRNVDAVARLEAFRRSSRFRRTISWIDRTGRRSGLSAMHQENRPLSSTTVLRENPRSQNSVEVETVDSFTSLPKSEA